MNTAIRPAHWGFVAVAAIATAILAASYLYIPVPAGTPFEAHLSGSLSSASASTGQTFGIVASSPLIVQGNVVVTAGAIGQGHVVSVHPVGKKPATIAVQLDWILSVDGRRLSLTASKPATTSSGSSSSTPTPVPSGQYAGAYSGSSATGTGGGAYGSSSGAASSNAYAPGKPLIFGVGGPFAKKFPKDKNIEVGPDLVFPAYTGQYTTVTVNS